MCGIVGYFANSRSGMWSGDISTVRDLVAADTVRGDDGTGLFFVKKDTKSSELECWYHKKPVTGPELLTTSQEWKSMLDGSRFVVAHNRAATIGSVTEDNTHPFTYGTVTGVHNGTVRSWKHTFASHVDKAEMDSQAVFEALSKVQPDQKSVAKLLATIDSGAYSLVWWDGRIEKLRFARNSQRPMHFVLTNGGFFFGSELRMLEWVLDRNGKKMLKALSTKTLTLIDVPMDGEPAEVFEYADMVPKPAPVQQYWRGYGADTDYPFEPYYDYSGKPKSQDPRYNHMGYSGSSRSASVTPRKVLVTNQSDLSKLDMDGWTRSKVESAVRYMCGNTHLSPMRDLTYSQGLAMVFAKDAPDAKDSSGTPTPFAKVHIVDMWKNTFLAYTEMNDDTIEPVTFITPADKHPNYEEIKDVLERGHEAIIEAPVIGVYAYATGDTAYAVGGILADNKEIGERTAAELVGESYANALEDITLGHPEIAFRQCTYGWHFGWMNK